MTEEKKCYFCNNGERFIPDAHERIQNQLDSPIDLTDKRICQLCAQILCKKVIDKTMSSLGGYKI